MISPTDTLIPIAITAFLIWLYRLSPKRAPTVTKGSPVYAERAAVNAGDVARAIKVGTPTRGGS